MYWKEETMKYICKALENRADAGMFKISFFNTTVPKLFKYSYYLLMLCSNDRSSPEDLWSLFQNYWRDIKKTLSTLLNPFVRYWW